MFKQIKELRIARKEKLQELEKVQRIAECFDCNAMADTYRYLNECFTETDCVETAPAVELNHMQAEEIKEAI